MNKNESSVPVKTRIMIAFQDLPMSVKNLPGPLLANLFLKFK